jgi:hypothetical protein
MQIITDNPNQAAAVAESLSEENVNNELEALGLPKGKVIQGLCLSAYRFVVCSREATI